MIRGRMVVAVLVAAGMLAAACDRVNPAPLPDRVVVSWALNSNDTPEEKAKFLAVLDRFTEQTGIPVTYRQPASRDSYPQTLMKDIAAGRPPDVALLPQPGLLATLAHCAGVLTPLPEEVQQAAKTNFSDLWRHLGEVGGTPYGLVFKAANKSTVWYDSNVFADAGVKPPTTWAEFLDVARAVRKDSASAIAIGGSDQWVLTDWFENVYLRQAGPEKYDQLAAHEIHWTDPSVERALTTLGELWGDADLVDGNPATMTLDQSVKQVFDQHNAGMVFEGDFLVNQVGTYVGPSGLGSEAQFFDFPSFGAAQPSVIVGGDTAVMTRNTTGAAKLMEFLASPDAARGWAASGGLISPNEHVPLATYPDPVSRASAARLTTAQVVRFDLSDLLPPDFGSTPNEGLWSGLHDLLALPAAQRRSPAMIKRTLSVLEARARSAYTRPPSCPGS